jgi:NAD(P)-dependent dehydrogenase (short-subunit alcohol dehydrogenase family)
VALDLLRPGVLAGVRVAVAGEGELGGAVLARARELGAGEADPSGPLDVLVWDGAVPPATGGDGIAAALDAAWPAVRPVGVAGAPARILLLAPRPGGPEAEAVRAGLENLARTLSIEWARFGIRPVALLPGDATSPAEVAELTAFLASPAGEYYSGCAFTLGSAS